MKLKKILSVVLSVFLLTGCKEVYADALPELKNPEEWGEIYQVKVEIDSFDQTGKEEETFKESSLISFYEDGGSIVGDVTADGKKTKSELHFYKTDSSAYLIQINDSEREERALSSMEYDVVYSSYMIAAMLFYYPFEAAYTLAEDLVDEAAINDIYASVPDIDSIKLTQLGHTFKLDVKGVNKINNKDHDQHIVIEFNAKDGIPRFVKTKTTVKDGNNLVLNSSDEFKYSYRETLPKYNGPKVK